MYSIYHMMFIKYGMHFRIQTTLKFTYLIGNRGIKNPFGILIAKTEV